MRVLSYHGGDGAPRLRAPKSEITTRMLLLHTAGFGYDLFNQTYNRVAEQHGQSSVITASREALMTPLLFDPGEKWEYGSNMAWYGLVVEGITGMRLGDVFRKHIFDPVGIEDMTFELNDDLRDRLAIIHSRKSDGSLTSMDFELPDSPAVHMSGSLYVRQRTL